jgi:hypothetical protein
MQPGPDAVLGAEAVGGAARLRWQQMAQGGARGGGQSWWLVFS